MMEITEYRYKLLTRLDEDGFLRPEDFESTKDFNYACEVALAMLEEGLLRTNQEKPYILNMDGTEANYTIMGEFKLSERSLNAIKSGGYERYKKSRSESVVWNLDRRLALWGVLVALIATLVAVIGLNS